MGIDVCPVVAQGGFAIDLGNFIFGGSGCLFAHGWVVGLAIGWVVG